MKQVIYGLAQDSWNSSALAKELLPSHRYESDFTSSVAKLLQNQSW